MANRLLTIHGEEWELRPACPNCGQRKSVRIYATDLAGVIVIRYFHCRACGVRFRQTFRR